MEGGEPVLVGPDTEVFPEALLFDEAEGFTAEPLPLGAFFSAPRSGWLKRESVDKSASRAAVFPALEPEEVEDFATGPDDVVSPCLFEGDEGPVTAKVEELVTSVPVVPRSVFPVPPFCSHSDVDC